MPYPTPVQIASGSAAVVSSTLLSLLLAPSASTLAASLTAIGSLLLGVAVAILLRPRPPRAVVPPEPSTATAADGTVKPNRQSHIPRPRQFADPAQPAPSVYAAYLEYTAQAAAQRPEVRV